MKDFGTMVHKDTKQVLHHITRHGRHFTNGRQSRVRYVGSDNDGNIVELTAAEFRAYVPAIVVGETARYAGMQHTTIAAEQLTKLQAMVTTQATHTGGPNRGKVASEETHKVRGIVID